MRTESQMITIIVPAYNAEKYLEQCLCSLANQTEKAFKVIIVNDGSTDKGTEEISKKYVEKYPEIFQYQYHENQGPGATRNAGIRLVTTEWTGFLDSDDWYPSYYIERFYQAIEATKDSKVDIYFTLPWCYDEANDNVYKWKDKKLFEEVFGCNPSERTVVDLEKEQRLFGLEVNVCRKIFRTEFLRKSHFAFPEGVKWEDVFPHYYAIEQAKVGCSIGDIGFYYRTNNPDSITANTTRGCDDLLKVFHEFFCYLFQEQKPLEMMNCAMDCAATFFHWFIETADCEVRKDLVDELSDFCRHIPNKTKKDYYDRFHRNIFFLKTLESKIFKKIWYDYRTIEKIRMVRYRINHRLGRTNEDADCEC